MRGKERGEIEVDGGGRKKRMLWKEALSAVSERFPPARWIHVRAPLCSLTLEHVHIERSGIVYDGSRYRDNARVVRLRVRPRRRP